MTHGSLKSARGRGSATGKRESHRCQPKKRRATAGRAALLSGRFLVGQGPCPLQVGRCCSSSVHEGRSLAVAGPLQQMQHREPRQVVGGEVTRGESVNDLWDGKRARCAG